MNLSYLPMPGTFSKSPAFWGFEPGLHVTEAKGQYLTLSDGRTYLDWVGGLGGNLISYNDPLFLQALTDQLHKVSGSVSLPTSLEYEVAELLCAMLGWHVPGWSPDLLSARFGKTGSDATTMAVRLARAVTGRDWVVTFKGGYHGWHDWTVCRTPPAHGIPVHSKGYNCVNYTIDLPWGDDSELVRFENIDSSVAAVIFEVGVTDPDPEYLRLLRRLCDDHGVLLIVDEVVTGLRYGLGGACERYGIRPDLVCMGKALGNGRPVSALVGPREYLDWFKRDDPVFCSSTHFGEPLDLAAAKFILSHWGENEVNWLWHTGDLLMDGLRVAGWKVIGHGARSLVTFDSDDERAYFIQGARARGLLMNRPNFTTRATTIKMVEQTVIAAEEVREEYEATDPEEVKRLMADKLPRVLFRGR